jgi:hypothetical protein
VAEHSELIDGDRWIISCDYRAVAEVRFRAADAVIWLDLSRTACFFRAIARKLKVTSTPLADSWRWIWRYPSHGRRHTAAALDNPQFACSIDRLRSSSDVTSFLSQMGS